MIHAAWDATETQDHYMIKRVSPLTLQSLQLLYLILGNCTFCFGNLVAFFPSSIFLVPLVWLLDGRYSGCSSVALGKFRFSVWPMTPRDVCEHQVKSNFHGQGTHTKPRNLHLCKAKSIEICDGLHSDLICSLTWTKVDWLLHMISACLFVFCLGEIFQFAMKDTLHENVETKAKMHISVFRPTLWDPGESIVGLVCARLKMKHASFVQVSCQGS